MRQEQQTITVAPRTIDFKFRFQMTSAGARHACSVTIQAFSEADATTIYRSNWLAIEKLARRSLAANDRTEIRLDGAFID